MVPHSRWINSSLEYAEPVSYLFPTEHLTQRMWAEARVLYDEMAKHGCPMPSNITFEDLIYFALKLFEIEDIAVGGEVLFDDIMEEILSDVHYEMQPDMSSEEYSPVYQSACNATSYVREMVVKYYQILRPHLLRWLPEDLFEQHDLHNVDIIDGDLMITVIPRG